ncbi:MAG: LAGLIDADG family homing endonuclease [Patescibacteria group bacterium]
MFTKDYIVGLVDGEGSFTAFIHSPNKDNGRKRRTRAEPKFFLKLVEKDKIILDDLKRYFNCGNIYFQKDSRKNHQNCYRFEVTKREDLEKVIIPFFEQNRLRFPSKLKDFKIFCEIMERIKKREHLTNAGLSNLYKLKQKMH